VDNARIEVSGPEVPIMDGSSAPFVFLIQCAGIREQSKAKKVLRVLKRVEVEEGDKRCALYPAAGFKISYLLDYDHPLLRKRHVTIDFARQAYTREISRARTFGFLHEVDDPGEKETIRNSLLAYCRLDTLAMVKIWGKLKEC